MKFWSAIVLTCALAASGSKSDKTHSHGPHPRILIISDHVEVILDGRAKSALHVDPSVHMTLDHGVMRLEAKKEAEHRQGPHRVHWSRPDGFSGLHEIQVLDRGQLQGKHLQGLHTLKSASKNDVHLQDLHLAVLEQNGSGHTHLSGWHRKSADIFASAGKLTLQGKLNMLRIQASKTARVDGHHLESQYLWASASGQAVAFLHPLTQSHVLASQHAKIVLEKKTDYSSTLLAQEGEIIYSNPYSI